MNIRKGSKAIACLALVGTIVTSVAAVGDGLRSPVGLLNLGRNGDIGLNLGRRGVLPGNIGGGQIDDAHIGLIGVDLGGRRSNGNVGLDVSGSGGILGGGHVGGILGR